MNNYSFIAMGRVIVTFFAEFVGNYFISRVTMTPYF